MSDKILVIDDDTHLLKIVEVFLKEEGYQVFTAKEASHGLRQAFNKQPDLVLLDVMMPEVDGWETLTRLRAISDMPIIMLTAKDKETDVVKGLDLGADDYVTKPFDPDELKARIAATLRRARMPATPQQTAAYADDHLHIDFVRRRVEVKGESINLTPTEFRLLTCLVRHAGHVVPHRVLLSEVWGPEYVDETQYLKLYVRYLRQKIEKDPGNPEYILTEWGEGYYFRETP
ncbi:MAG: DNA-binding response regulator [Chloroflexi bacterium]|nr:MAG: DNA-binding response regulator [Chloroflexota bacterium]